MQVKSFVFNPFQENTYVVYDESGSCIIIDPGCVDTHEKSSLKAFIDSEGLKPEKLINTHCHLDHIFGNAFISETYKLGLLIPEKELEVLKMGELTAETYGMPSPASPEPAGFLVPGENLNFGNSSLEILSTPGHSPGHISLYAKEENFVISGDVLFNGSIGRTDLPGGDFDTLIRSIKEKLLVLPDNCRVYCGHGPSTNIQDEKAHNPFLQS